MDRLSLGRALLAGLVIAPLVTWLPMLAMKFPGLGLPPYHPQAGIDIWPMQMWWTTLFVMAASFIWTRDRWLAAAVLLAAWPIALRGGAMNPTHSLIFVIGSVVITLLRDAVISPHHVRWTLVSMGVLQSVYALQQKWLHYDLLWGGLWGGALVTNPQPLGTLGTVDALATYAAVTAPLMPVVLLPLAIAAVISSKSLTGCAALSIGLLVRYRGLIFKKHREESWHVLAASVAAGAVLILGVVLNKPLDSFWGRLVMQDFGAKLAYYNAPWFGFGLGAWAAYVPQAQLALKFSPTGELWVEAHNEYVQWGMELGLAGLIVLAGWLWTQRRAFASPVWGASLAGLACACVGFFPFHTVPTSLLGIAVLAMAFHAAGHAGPTSTPTHAR